jgi:hypothetical protein
MVNNKKYTKLFFYSCIWVLKQSVLCVHHRQLYALEVLSLEPEDQPVEASTSSREGPAAASEVDEGVGEEAGGLSSSSMLSSLSSSR